MHMLICVNVTEQDALINNLDKNKRSVDAGAIDWIISLTSPIILVSV